MATIQRQESKRGTRWRAMVRLKGTPVVTQTFTRRANAKRWAERLEAEFRSGRYLPRLEAERRSLAEAIDRYVEERGKGSTWIYLRWWRARLGRRSLAVVTSSVISEALRSLLRGEGPSGRPVCGATTNRYLAALSAVLTAAWREWEWIQENPARRIKRKPESRGRVRFLSDEEREKLLGVCRESSDWRLYPLVLFAIATGARQGELLGLRWEHVNLAERVAVLHDTKNGDRRPIYFAGPTGEVLDRMARIPHISGYLFAAPNGMAHFPRKPWLQALEVAEIDNFRFHDLRHTAASYLAMSGATLAELADFLGHRSLQMVRRYAHLAEGHTRPIAEKMAERYLT